MDQYHKIEKIGSGSFADVYGALTVSTNERVAIKKLNMKCKSVEDCRKLRETKALLKLDHPNIVRLKQIIKEYDTVILVLEYMECSLFDRMNRKKYFSEYEIMNMCFQIFDGLAHMHERGYFHRDLKPENLLVSGDVVKIAYFGFARKSNGKRTYTGNLGTPWYMAPEVLLYEPKYDSAVDMWAMGAIMAELFAGQPLFPGDGAGDQLFTICSVIGSPPENICNVGLEIGYRFPELPGVNLSSLLPSASPYAINLIATLLSWNPRERPTAKEALLHPFFYTRYDVPPPIPLVFVMVDERESEMEKKRLSLMETGSKSSATDSDEVDEIEDLINLLPDDPFY